MGRGSGGGDGERWGTKGAAAGVSDKKGDNASPLLLLLLLLPSPSIPPIPTLPLLRDTLRPQLEGPFPASLALPLFPNGAIKFCCWVRLLLVRVGSLQVQLTSTQPLHHPSPGRGGRIEGEDDDDDDDDEDDEDEGKSPLAP